MIRLLLLSSLLILTLTAGAADYLLPLGGRRMYGVAIEARGARLTGVCVVKTGEEGSRGAIVNEMGVHVMDFTLTADRRKVKLLNVLAQMDRWYLRRVLRKDLRLLFGATENGLRTGGRTVTVAEDGTVTLTNTKYKVKYSLREINYEAAE